VQNAVLSSQKTSRAGSQVGDVGEVCFPRTSWNSTSTHFSGAANPHGNWGEQHCAILHEVKIRTSGCKKRTRMGAGAHRNGTGRLTPFLSVGRDAHRRFGDRPHPSAGTPRHQRSDQREEDS